MLNISFVYSVHFTISSDVYYLCCFFMYMLLCVPFIILQESHAIIGNF